MPNDPNLAVELRLRAAVESSPSGLLMIDADGRIVLVNREIERLFGYPREELLGKPVDLLVPERMRGGHAAFRTGFLASPKTRAMGVGRDLYGRRKDGTEVPVEIGLTPVVTEEGVFVLSSIVDISARRRAEERFRVAVESSPNGMVMVDAEGRIVLVNREIERMFGYAREELLGQTIEMLVPPRFRVRHPDFRRSFYADPRARAMGAGRELFGLRKDGTEMPIEIGLNPIETDEGLLVLSSIVDISARKQAEVQHARLEDQLRQSQKMEALGRLAGGVAHDFNNILAAISGFGELARARVKGDVADDLDEVITAAARGKEIVERILRFSRRQEVTREPMDLAQTLAEASRLLRATLPAGIEIRLHVAESRPRVLADATSVQQVVMNLATNAAHAMPDGGMLEITLEPFYARDSFTRVHPTVREGSYARLAVRDTGQGMPPETLAHVFEPFFTTKGPGAGSGLGLSLVHGIMIDHGGSVWLESEPGRGTCAYCLFPVLEGEAPEEDLAATDAAPGRGELVLFVDDEPSLAILGRRRLEALGYRVVAATDAAGALARLREAPERFDLVVTDYSMPRMSGLELAREIHAARADLPIILLTGYMEEFPADDLAAAGVRARAKKPISLSDLAAITRAVLETGT